MKQFKRGSVVIVDARYFDKFPHTPLRVLECHGSMLMLECVITHEMYFIDKNKVMILH